MIRYLLCVSVLTVHLKATGWRPPERLLSAVKLVESSDGLFTYGDQGRSLGDFQLSEGAWLDVTSWRRSQGLKVYPYDRYVYNRSINRLYAADYLALLHGELTRKLKRAPSVGEIYAAYNMGLGTFAQCDYKLANVNPVTLKKCRQIKEMMRPKR